MTYPLATSSWGDEEIAAIQSVISAGMYTMGDSVSRFEKDFAEYIGSRYAVMVSSGSTANLLMTAALFFRKRGSLRQGDEIIVPAVSWPTTYYPLSQYGLNLKFVDIDAKTLNYDLDSLGKAIGPSTKAIMAVNLLGNPNDFGTINKLIAGKDIVLIEDNCESLGALYDGRQAGTFGIMGTFSTFFSHHMATMEGGVIVTDDEELYHILLCIRAHGWTRNLPKHNLVTGVKSDDPFEESFKFVLPGYNARPIEMEGAVGVEQLKKLDGFLAHRRGNAAAFRELMGGHPLVEIQQEIGTSSWFGFAMTLKDSSPLTRGAFAKILLEKGIECRPVVAGNFTKNPVIKYLPHEIYGELKNAERLDSRSLFVGNHQYDITEQIRYLRAVLDSI